MIDAKLSEITIYTSTLYDNTETSRVRSELCINMLKNSAALGIKVVIKDGGSSEDFIRRVKEFKNVVLVQRQPGEKAKSMGQDRRDALKRAMEISLEEKLEHPSFFWTEPEKDNLVSEENMAVMYEEIRSGSNIVVPARKENAFNTLPKNQCWFEKRAKKRALEILKEVSGGKHQELLDLWFGPKMFDLEGANYFINYNKDGGRADLSDAIIVPVEDAIRDGKKVSSVPVNYEYSESQRLNEIGEMKDLFARKRLEQYAQILRELGDEKWSKFFEDAEKDIIKIKELNKAEQPSSEQKQEITEKKKEILKNFFR